MRTLLVASLFALSVACGSGGGSSSDGSGGGTQILMGACTTAPDSTGNVVCQEMWAVPDPEVDRASAWRSVCANGYEGNTYSSGRCGGSPNPGCCYVPSARKDDPSFRNCYYMVDGDPQGLLQQSCVALEGVWE